MIKFILVGIVHNISFNCTVKSDNLNLEFTHLIQRTKKEMDYIIVLFDFVVGK